MMSLYLSVKTSACIGGDSPTHPTVLSIVALIVPLSDASSFSSTLESDIVLRSE